jgi:hypothetical protein
MKLTKEHLESLVVSKTITRPAGTLTICVITLYGGAQVTGESNVIDPRNFDQQIGEKMAYEDAIDKLWQLEGYRIKRNTSDHLLRAAKTAYEAWSEIEHDGAKGFGWDTLSDSQKRHWIEKTVNVANAGEMEDKDDAKLSDTIFYSVVRNLLN